MFSYIDHLVYGVSDLHSGISHFERLLSITPVFGGQHLGKGTHNALIALSTDCYLEIIAPDPQQKDVCRPYWIDVDLQMTPRLIRWAAKCSDLEALTKASLKHGINIGDIISGNRNLPDGTTLNWKLTDTRINLLSGLVPFFINWQESLHPAKSLPLECKLVEFNLEHPNPEQVSNCMNMFDLMPNVIKGVSPKITAKIQSPRGIVAI